MPSQQFRALQQSGAGPGGNRAKKNPKKIPKFHFWLFGFLPFPPCLGVWESRGCYSMGSRFSYSGVGPLLFPPSYTRLFVESFSLVMMTYYRHYGNKKFIQYDSVCSECIIDRCCFFAVRLLDDPPQAIAMIGAQCDTCMISSDDRTKNEPFQRRRIQRLRSFLSAWLQHARPVGSSSSLGLEALGIVSSRLRRILAERSRASTRGECGRVASVRGCLHRAISFNTRRRKSQPKLG